MLKSDIRKGGRYVAKVGGKLTTVRVQNIREQRYTARATTLYDVVNEKTGRVVLFRSAKKFRSAAVTEPVVAQPDDYKATAYYAALDDAGRRQHDQLVAAQRAGMTHRCLACRTTSADPLPRGDEHCSHEWERIEIPSSTPSGG